MNNLLQLDEIVNINEGTCLIIRQALKSNGYRSVVSKD